MEHDGEPLSGNVHRRRGLFVVEVGEIPQRERLLVAGSERAERSAQSAGVVVAVEVVVVVVSHPVPRPVGRPLSPVTTPTTGPSLPVEDLVAGDAVQPRCDAVGTGSETGQARERSLERDGSDVLGFGAVAGAAAREAVDPVDVAPVELGERVGIRASPFDECSFIVGSGRRPDHRP